MFARAPHPLGHPPPPGIEPAATSDYGPPLLVMLGLGAIDLAASRIDGIDFVGWTEIALVVIVLCAAGLFCRMLRGPRSLVDLTFYGAAWLAFGVLGPILTYITQRQGGALRDTQLGWADAALQFDTLSWSAWLAAHPLLHWLLTAAYESLPAQVAVTVGLLAVFGRSRRNSQLLLAAVLALVATAAVATLVPAAGVTKQLPGVADLFRLRGGGALSFAIERLHGVIAFPSYPAALGVLLIWANRDLRLTQAPIVLLGVAAIAAIPSETGQYLVGIPLGIGIGLYAIPVARLLLPQLQTSNWRVYILEPAELPRRRTSRGSEGRDGAAQPILTPPPDLSSSAAWIVPDLPFPDIQSPPSQTATPVAAGDGARTSRRPIVKLASTPAATVRIEPGVRRNGHAPVSPAPPGN